jgi:hypothetical protein
VRGIGQNTHTHDAGVPNNGATQKPYTNNGRDQLNETIGADNELGAPEAEDYNSVHGESAPGAIDYGETAPSNSLCISEPGAAGSSELIAPDADGCNVVPAEIVPDATHGGTTTKITGVDGKVSGVSGRPTGVTGTSNIVRYLFVIDRVEDGNMRIEYCPTGEMVADFFTKPLQGSLFRKLRGIILNNAGRSVLAGAATSQECVGKVTSYADVVRGTHRRSSSVIDDAHRKLVSNKHRGRE